MKETDILMLDKGKLSRGSAVFSQPATNLTRTLRLETMENYIPID